VWEPADVGKNQYSLRRIVSQDLPCRSTPFSFGMQISKIKNIWCWPAPLFYGIPSISSLCAETSILREP
jgi:hypothetical protein